MNIQLNIPLELVNIDRYFNYTDVLFDEFLYIEKAISTEGMIGDIWDGIKKAVKWLIEKIGEFISFIINLIKKAFDYIANLIKKITSSSKKSSSVP